MTLRVVVLGGLRRAGLESAANLIACRLHRCWAPPAAAVVCTGLLSLAEFEGQFSRWAISTSLRRL